MMVIDWREIPLDGGVLREPESDETRLIVWLPGEGDGHLEYWERIGNVARGEIAVERRPLLDTGHDDPDEAAKQGTPRQAPGPPGRREGEAILRAPDRRSPWSNAATGQSMACWSGPRIRPRTSMRNKSGRDGRRPGGIGGSDRDCIWWKA